MPTQYPVIRKSLYDASVLVDQKRWLEADEMLVEIELLNKLNPLNEEEQRYWASLRKKTNDGLRFVSENPAPKQSVIPTMVVLQQPCSPCTPEPTQVLEHSIPPEATYAQQNPQNMNYAVIEETAPCAQDFQEGV